MLKLMNVFIAVMDQELMTVFFAATNHIMIYIIYKSYILILLRSLMIWCLQRF